MNDFPATEPSKRYHYLVVYSFDGGGRGNGSFKFDHPIASIDDIRTIEREIREDTGHQSPVVTNYQLLREE